MKAELTKERNYGVDLLRIVSMAMIAMLHVLGHGGVLGASADNAVSYSVVWLLEVAAYCAVNCYALISGYVGYGAKHKYSNIVTLYLQVVFWIVAFTAIFAVLVPGSVGMKDFVKALFPFAFNTYWYFTAYFCMFFFIPFINILMDSLNRKQAGVLIATIIIIFSIIPTVFQNDMFKVSKGSSALWLAMLYLIGAYIRKYSTQIKGNKKYYLFIYVGCVLITWISKCGVELITKKPLGDGAYTSPLVSYVSPTVLLSAIALLLLFSNICLNKTVTRIVSFFAPLTFGVYLIHEEPLVRQYLVAQRFAIYGELSPVFTVFCVLGTAVGIWLLCSLMDFVRAYLFKLLRIKEICNRIEQVLIKKIEK